MRFFVSLNKEENSERRLFLDFAESSLVKTYYPRWFNPAAAGSNQTFRSNLQD